MAQSCSLSTHCRYCLPPMSSCIPPVWNFRAVMAWHSPVPSPHTAATATGVFLYSPCLESQGCHGTVLFPLHPLPLLLLPATDDLLYSPCLQSQGCHGTVLFPLHPLPLLTATDVFLYSPCLQSQGCHGTVLFALHTLLLLPATDVLYSPCPEFQGCHGMAQSSSLSTHCRYCYCLLPMSSCIPPVWNLRAVTAQFSSPLHCRPLLPVSS